METVHPLVLTLRLDDSTFRLMNGLRQQHFPKERNFLPAHVTLFHALPGEQIESIRQNLQTRCDQTPKLTFHLPTVRFLGKGVAIHLQCSQLVHLQRDLMMQWQDWLSRQDRQTYHPHITIQNKVAPGEARQLYETLLQTWQPLDGYGEGLLLWHYQGSPWALADEFHFNGNKAGV